MALKTTQKAIKEGIRCGAIIELTDTRQIESGDLENIAMSFGIYGMNGGVWRHRKTGKLYGIASRCSALFYYV